MKRKPNARPHGQIRRGQLITTFGPGAMVDLPDHSVLVGGLQAWSQGGEEIIEPRLSQKLALLLQVPSVRLMTPPAENDDPLGPSTGIDVYQFPEWFITQDVEADARDAPFRTRMLVHRTALTKGKIVDDRKKPRKVTPVRFVRACRAGHIDDIDWRSFVHNGRSECRRQLWIDERGTSGDLTEVWIRCDCKLERSMAQASIAENRALGNCNGSRPWLGAFSKEACGEPNRLLIRTASNAYFPQKLTVISLPERDEMVTQAIDAAWENLEAVESIDDLRYERKKAKVKAALEGVTDEEAFAEISRRRSGQAKDLKPVKIAELETLVSCREELGADNVDGTFYARSLPGADWDEPWMKDVERVVLVHRLREVCAQVGFTRFEAAAPDADGELDAQVRRAALSLDMSWLPAIENRGEGVFLQFKESAVDQWLTKTKVKARGTQLQAGFNSWKAERNGSRRPFPGLPFLMLHSLSHMLITSVSLECGYPSSSIRERIYAVPGLGYGILLYTGSSDAEGTLGGLVQVGRHIASHVRNALKLAELCSNDPVCAQHEAPNAHEHRFLHGAACHGCLLIGETSCEQQNDFLDRALVVRTVENCGSGFFEEDN